MGSVALGVLFCGVWYRGCCWYGCYRGNCRPCRGRSLRCLYDRMHGSRIHQSLVDIWRSHTCLYVDVSASSVKHVDQTWKVSQLRNHIYYSSSCETTHLNTSTPHVLLLQSVCVCSRTCTHGKTSHHWTTYTLFFAIGISDSGAGTCTGRFMLVFR